ASACELDERGEPFVPGEGTVLGEAPMLGDAVARAAGRGVEDEPLDALGLRRGERDRDRAADAAADDAGAVDAEGVEEVGALAGVVLPRQALDAPARAPRLTLVERDAREALGEPVEQVQALVDPEGAPVLDRCVEAAGREEQERRPVAADLVVGLDPVAG